MEYIKLNFDLKTIEIQYHVHEFQGYLKMADDHHYHRFAAVTGEAIPVDKNDHIHEVVFRTDYINGHYHEYIGRTSGAIVIGDRHVHCIDTFTREAAGHKHAFRMVTLIHDPIGY